MLITAENKHLVSLQRRQRSRLKVKSEKAKVRKIATTCKAGLP
jgi:hypothetical protein